MPSERVQRQIDRLLDEAETAIAERRWEAVLSLAREVLSFDEGNEDALAFVQSASSMLQSPTVVEGPPGSDRAPAVTGEKALPLPTSFVSGRYEVKRFLGEGGKKRVYLAHDTTLDRDVAFALIKTEGLDDASRQRISREAQAMGRLGDHPNIVTVHDMGEEEGQPYMVLPLLAGGDVERFIEKAYEHKLPLEQAIRIASETCAGLALAHGKGIVHRDLKPGNVWLTEDGTAKIGDFGLAVAVDRSRLTQAGMMVGTVGYMPPEQAMGGEVTPQSDLYSLGCMLYEMVTGRPPFVGDESVAVIGQHLNTPPVTPTWHRPDCPPALEGLILRLLEKDASKRPGSAEEVKQALEAAGQAPVGATTHDSVVEESAHDHNPLYNRVFVGREPEVKQLQGAYDAALSGQGGLTMVVGEPGIGKTTVCEQLATYVSLRGGKTLVGHCYEEGSLSFPYLGFVEAMRSYVLDRDPEGLKSDLGTGAADVARIVSEIRDRVDGIELREENEAEDDRYRLLQAVSTFLRKAASVTPLVIILEDLHWADRGTLDLLLHVARNLQGTRLLIVGTYRDVEVDRAHPLSGALAELRRGSTFSRVTLRGLTQDEVHRMMSALATQDVQWSLAEAVFRQTEGNPLFFQEVMRYIVEEGLVERTETGRWQGATEETPLIERIPEGLRDVIGKRLSRLSSETNRLLSTAAVIGRDFDLETLRRVVGLPEEELLIGIEEAMRVGILEERPQTGAVSYRFPHAFFRQTLYEEMIAPRRLQTHQAVARALEEQYASRTAEHAAELAEHFSQSTDRDDLVKAVEYGELAARRATVVYAHGEATANLERCLEIQEVLDPEDKAKRSDLLLTLGEALIPQRATQRLEEAAEMAFSLADALGNGQQKSRAVRLGRWSLQSRYGGRSAGETDGHRRWQARAEGLGKQGEQEQVQADLTKAAQLANQGRFAARWELLQKALAVAHQFEDPSDLFDVGTGLISTGTTPLRQTENARDLSEELVQWPRQGLPPLLGAFGPTGWTGVIALMWGERARCEKLWNEMAELAERVHDQTTDRRVLLTQIALATVDGRLNEAFEIAEILDTGDLSTASLSGNLIATTRARLWLGKAAHVRDAFKKVRALGGNLPPDGDPTPESIRSKWTLALAHEGLFAEARHDLTKVLEAARALGPLDDLSLEMLTEFLETAVFVEENKVAAELAFLVKPYSELITGHSPTVVARHLGGASALLGNPDEARDYYAEALEVCERVRFRPEIALTRLQLGELLLEHYPDERADAIEHLDFAIGEFQEMKMQPSLERALRHRELLKA